MGRVGALAIALGIGAGVCAGGIGVARADGDETPGPDATVGSPTPSAPRSMAPRRGGPPPRAATDVTARPGSGGGARPAATVPTAERAPAPVDGADSGGFAAPTVPVRISQPRPAPATPLAAADPPGPAATTPA
ncbi:MAG: hypothetical protein FGM52_11325, partial [Mycobacterium sp.]|nr:hypothetical protein [Mycobacterium sp.]